MVCVTEEIRFKGFSVVTHTMHAGWARADWSGRYTRKTPSVSNDPLSTAGVSR